MIKQRAVKLHTFRISHVRRIAYAVDHTSKATSRCEKRYIPDVDKIFDLTVYFTDFIDNVFELPVFKTFVIRNLLFFFNDNLLNLFLQ